MARVFSPLTTLVFSLYPSLLTSCVPSSTLLCSSLSTHTFRVCSCTCAQPRSRCCGMLHLNLHDCEHLQRHFQGFRESNWQLIWLFYYDGAWDVLLVFLTDEGIGKKINESCAALRSGGFWLTEFFFRSLVFLYPEILQPCASQKKNTEGHNGLFFTVLPAYLWRWRYEVHIADNTSVDSSVELAVYGLCQRHQKRRAASKDAVAAVKRSIHSSHLYQQHSRRTDEDGWHSHSMPPSSTYGCWLDTATLKSSPKLSIQVRRPGALMLRRCY